MRACPICIVCPLLLFAFGCNPAATPPASQAELTPVAPATAAAAPNETTTSAAAEASDSLALFEQRILPIFQSTKPSSCAECHLSGVDLKDYVRPTQAETFAALSAAGLIDVKSPEASKILTFIQRQPDKSSLISQEVRQQEYAAFRAWILAACADEKLLAAQDAAAPAGPQVPLEVVRHARQDHVLASFLENIWIEAARCAACHSPDRNAKQVKEHGDQVSWIKLNDSRATLDYLVERGLIDAAEPEQSLLLLKPTLQVKHGGGQKMMVGDRSYKQFRRFLDDYAVIVQGSYRSADELPAESDEVSVITELWLKIDGVPGKYDKQLLQVDVFCQADGGWSQRRIATSDRAVFGPKNLWQHSLSLTAPRDSQAAEKLESKQLPPGRYLARLYIDQTGKLAKDYTAELNDDDFVGQVEFDTRWPAGYGEMTVIEFPQP